jgi:hypothetical protein
VGAAQPAQTLDAAQDARSSNVVVSSTAACAPHVTHPEADGGAARAPKPSFLADPVIQQRVEVLARELEAAGHPQLGTYSDPVERAAVVVLPQAFTGYAALRERLAARVLPLRVVLRPACYPREKIDEAQRVIAEQNWHPRAKEVAIAGHFDPAFSGYTVTVHESAPEVASALAERLGPLVRVRLGKPRPGGSPPQ